MRKAYYIFMPLCILLFASFGKQSSYNEPETKLAFCLNMYANSGPVTYGILIVWGDQIVKRTYITQEAFLRVATGEEYSKANPDSTNLLLENEILGCTIEKDSLFGEITYNFGTISEIWKLRYSAWPFEGRNESGWAANAMMPSPGQEAILQSYGVKYYNDWIIADEMWRLLRDMQDPAWVETYKSS